MDPKDSVLGAHSPYSLHVSKKDWPFIFNMVPCAPPLRRGLGKDQGTDPVLPTEPRGQREERRWEMNEKR